MATFNYNCATVPDHVLVECGDYELGGHSAVALLDKDHGIADFSDATDWNTAIASGKAIVIQGISAEIPEASPLTQASAVGGGLDQTSNYDRTVTWMDMNVTAENQDFYNALMNQKRYVAVFNENSKSLKLYTDKPAEFQVREVAPKTGDAWTHYAVTARWRQKPLATLVVAPTGIFE